MLKFAIFTIVKVYKISYVFISQNKYIDQERMKHILLQPPEEHSGDTYLRVPKRISSYISRARFRLLNMQHEDGRNPSNLSDSNNQTKFTIHMKDINSIPMLKSFGNEAKRSLLTSERPKNNENMNIFSPNNKEMSQRKDRKQFAFKKNQHLSVDISKKQDNEIVQKKKQIKCPKINRYKTEPGFQTQNLNEAVVSAIKRFSNIHRSESQGKVFISNSYLSEKSSIFGKRLRSRKDKKMKGLQLSVNNICESFFGNGKN